MRSQLSDIQCFEIWMEIAFSQKKSPAAGGGCSGRFTHRWIGRRVIHLTTKLDWEEVCLASYLLGGTVCPRLVVDLYIGNFIFIVQRKKRMSAMHQKHTSPYDIYILNSVY